MLKTDLLNRVMTLDIDFLLVLALATTAVTDGLSYTTMTAGVHNGYNSNAGIPFIPETDALTFFSTEAVFDTAEDHDAGHWVLTFPVFWHGLLWSDR